MAETVRICPKCRKVFFYRDSCPRCNRKLLKTSYTDSYWNHLDDAARAKKIEYIVTGKTSEAPVDSSESAGAPAVSPASEKAKRSDHRVEVWGAAPSHSNEPDKDYSKLASLLQENNKQLENIYHDLHFFYMIWWVGFWITVVAGFIYVCTVRLW